MYNVHFWPAGGSSDSFDPLAVQPLSGVSSFMYSELRKITGNFDDRSVSNGGSRLGEGGFGTVYKGFLSNRPVAVKKLNPVSQSLYVEEDTLFHTLNLRRPF